MFTNIATWKLYNTFACIALIHVAKRFISWNKLRNLFRISCLCFWKKILFRSSFCLAILLLMISVLFQTCRELKTLIISLKKNYELSKQAFKTENVIFAKNFFLLAKFVWKCIIRTLVIWLILSVSEPNKNKIKRTPNQPTTHAEYSVRLKIQLYIALNVF